MDSYFVEALDLSKHPIIKSKRKFKEEYYMALVYAINRTVNSKIYSKGTCSRKHSPSLLVTGAKKKYIFGRLKEYYHNLFSELRELEADCLDDKMVLSKAFISCVTERWLQKYPFMLICDIALILMEKELITYALSLINEYISNTRRKEVDKVKDLLYNDWSIAKKYSYVDVLIKQFRSNNKFLSQKERRILVTANMSAGKSTLINALTGKYLAHTSQEVCTGNVCYIYNKPFEDNDTNLFAGHLKMFAQQEELSNYGWNEKIVISSYFRTQKQQFQRLCLIDTPGVDSALNDIHGEITYKVLNEVPCDVVLCVMSPTQLGTDAEKEHLQWLSKNVDKNKVVFVLNKMDNYRKDADSIDESIQALRCDLLEYGFMEPTICPISAYFSYLLKLRMSGGVLSLDDSDEYDYLARKFMRDFYDLSRYYPSVNILDNDSEEVILSKRTGLYGLEEIVYGGNL